MLFLLYHVFFLFVPDKIVVEVDKGLFDVIFGRVVLGLMATGDASNFL